MLSLHIITFPQGYVGALRSNTNKTKHQIYWLNTSLFNFDKHKGLKVKIYIIIFGVYTAAMSFTHIWCYKNTFLCQKTLLIKINKKRRGGAKKWSGRRRETSFFLFTWPYWVREMEKINCWTIEYLTVSLALIIMPISDIRLSRKLQVPSKSWELSLIMYNSKRKYK